MIKLETKQTIASKSEIGKQYAHLRILTKESGDSNRHRIMMLVPTTLREVAVNKFVLIISAVYVVHALWRLV